MSSENLYTVSPIAPAIPVGPLMAVAEAQRVLAQLGTDVVSITVETAYGPVTATKLPNGSFSFTGAVPSQVLTTIK